MATVSVEARLAALEAEVARLKAKVEGTETGDPWTDVVFGAFANDPAFEEAMRLGREYRESQRPRPRKKRESQKPSKNRQGNKPKA